MGDSDSRIPISESLRDELRARKRGDETYNDVIERLLSGGSATDVPVVECADCGLAGPIGVTWWGQCARCMCSEYVDKETKTVDPSDLPDAVGSELM